MSDSRSEALVRQETVFVAQRMTFGKRERIATHGPRTCVILQVSIAKPELTAWDLVIRFPMVKLQYKRSPSVQHRCRVHSAGVRFDLCDAEVR